MKFCCIFSHFSSFFVLNNKSFYPTSSFFLIAFLEKIFLYIFIHSMQFNRYISNKETLLFYYQFVQSTPSPDFPFGFLLLENYLKYWEIQSEESQRKRDPLKNYIRDLGLQYFGIYRHINVCIYVYMLQMELDR